MSRSLVPRVLLLAHALCWAPVMAPEAWAQDADRLKRVTAALPPAAARDLENTITAARAEGLPTRPLVDKALEGTAKGVPPDQLLAVVRSLATELAAARDLLGPNAAHDELKAVADALRRGVPRQALEDIRASARGEASIVPAVYALGDLLERGVPVDAALDVLGAWQSRDGGPDKLRELPMAVERLIREGSLPAQAAAAVASRARGGGPDESGAPPDGASDGAGLAVPGKGPAAKPTGPPGAAGGKGRSRGRGKTNP